MSAALGLDSLLAALREAGLTVGVAEMARLQQVFTLGPTLGAPEDRRLKAVLGAVLVKSDEDRIRFEPVFESWIGRADLEVSLREAAQPPEPKPTPRTPQPRRYVWRVLTVAFLILLSLIGHSVKIEKKGGKPGPIPTSISQIPTPAHTAPPTPQGRTPIPQTPTPTPQTPTPIPQTPTPTPSTSSPAPAPIPTPNPVPGNPVWRGGPALSLGGFAFLTAVGLWLALRRRRWLPEPAPDPVKKGPPRVFLTPPQLAGSQLLEPREEEALVWGIGHFVLDEPTRRLDLPATVRETARSGGIPHLLYHKTRHQREVWLWVDEAADDPTVQRLAGEVEEALQASGLPVERALFHGIPDWLVRTTGQAFAPNEVDERRSTALVALLTDGRILERQYAADDRRIFLDALLRSLSHWPQLAVVDFSAAPSTLVSILEKHSILTISPAELAPFLGSDGLVKRNPATSGPDDAVWAAACALAPSSVDEERAFEIRQRMKLTTSPWALRDLRAAAPGPSGRLEWKPEDRARRVNWLRKAESQFASGIAADSFLAKALNFWEDVYDREMKSWQVGSAQGIGPGTPAYRYLSMERALLSLWRNPATGIRQLYRLHGGVLREIIQRHLRNLTPLNRGGPAHVELPWPWEARSGPEQVMLQEMRLGGNMPPATLQRPGRFWLGLGLCLGLAAGAFSAIPFRKESCWNGTLLEEHGMTFVYICPGTFSMGSSFYDDNEADTDEKPAHQVTLSEFWIGRTEVTNVQYRKVHPNHKGPDNIPATEVTWNDAQAFCTRYGWRLPTEAEWEYAARTGKQTPWFFGADERKLGKFAWLVGNPVSQPHPVATRAPNRWGIYDLNGNVWEWVEDWYGFYELGPQKNPKKTNSGEFRIVRGGAFYDPPRHLRSANREGVRPWLQDWGIGFRCARSPDAVLRPAAGQP